MSVAPLLAVLAALPPPLCGGRIATGYDPAQDAEPSPRALAEVQAAYDALCPSHDCGRGTLFSNPTAGMNAYTWVAAGPGGAAATVAKIVYSRAFLDALNARFGPGASFGVLAHEVGHHLTAARSARAPNEPAWSEELRADYLAGCALGRFGRTPEALEAALRALAAVATATHPSFRERVPVVRRGYETCGRDDALEPAAAAFGLGSLLGAGRPSDGCWRYRYRLVEEMLRLGPIGPRLRASSGHASESACEAARRARDDRRSERCRCA